MTSAVSVSDSRALTPYSATQASKVLGEAIAATLSCQTGKDAGGRTLLRAPSRSRPVNMFFMAAGGSLLKREAGHHDAEVNS